ncbi:hypothetical protein CC2G_015081 [Coprinopsis cinerea AmutBmut pab1-1]|nr:hypothetical protein CC2G_015081 [Coprinopsis cinerea AmutBmut pab1-1]
MRTASVIANSSASMVKGNRLPPEILSDVIRYLQDSGTLTAIMSSNKRFHSIAAQERYWKVELSGQKGYKALQMLASGTETADLYCSLIKVLVIGNDHLFYNALAKRRSVIIDANLPLIALTYWRRIEDVQLVPQLDFTSLVPVLDAFERNNVIQSLKVLRLRLAPSINIPEFIDLVSLVLPGLESLIFEHWAIDLMELLGYLRDRNDRLPNLRRLVLNPEGHAFRNAGFESFRDPEVSVNQRGNVSSVCLDIGPAMVSQEF